MTAPRSPRSLARTVAVVGGLALASALAACSLIVDKSVDVCAATSDCRKKDPSFAGSICVSSACVFGCKDNASCIDDGDVGVCVAGRCQSLFAHGCYAVSTGETTATEARGAPAEIRSALSKSDELVLFGALLPDDGQKGTERWNGVRTAIDDWNRLGGVPRTKGNKSLAFVACPDTTDAATYLTSLGVHALVGGNGSSSTLKIANEVTIPGHALLFAPSATSRDITARNSALLWRAAPSDDVQAEALIALLAPLGELAKGQPGAPLNVATIFVNDAYGDSLSKLVTQKKPANVKTSTFFYATSKDDAGTTSATLAGSVSDVVGFHPDVVVIVGSTEVISGIYRPLADALRSAPPYFVFSDGAKSDALAQAVIKDDFWRPRVRVTAPKEPPLDRTAYDPFLTSYRRVAGGSPNAYGVAGAYDATYLLALAAAGLGDGEAMTGEALATVLRRVSNKSGARTPAVSDSIQSAARALSSGQGIDFLGASGELDFIEGRETGEANSPISVYCVGGSGTGDAQSTFTEVTYYESGKGLAAGRAECP